MTITAEMIFQTMLQIRDGIDVAKNEGIPCDYPGAVEFDVEGVNFVVPWDDNSESRFDPYQELWASTTLEALAEERCQKKPNGS